MAADTITNIVNVILITLINVVLREKRPVITFLRRVLSENALLPLVLSRRTNIESTQNPNTRSDTSDQR